MAHFQHLHYCGFEQVHIWSCPPSPPVPGEPPVEFPAPARQRGAASLAHCRAQLPARLMTITCKVDVTDSWTSQFGAVHEKKNRWRWLSKYLVRCNSCSRATAASNTPICAFPALPQAQPQPCDGFVAQEHAKLYNRYTGRDTRSLYPPKEVHKDREDLKMTVI